jgi:hypothetical protein
MSRSGHIEIPDSVKDYLGHDKVALFGRGGRLAPPAPPDSPARKHGELAVREALAAIGTPNQPGERPAATPPKSSMARKMRSRSEQALMEASMAKLGTVKPHTHSTPLWSGLFVPFWKALPWSLKKRILNAASGVKGWRRPS